MRQQQHPQVFVGFKLPLELATKVRALAARDGRTVSAYVRRLIARDVAASAAEVDGR